MNAQRALQNVDFLTIQASGRHKKGANRAFSLQKQAEPLPKSHTSITEIVQRIVIIAKILRELISDYRYRIFFFELISIIAAEFLNFRIISVMYSAPKIMSATPTTAYIGGLVTGMFPTERRKRSTTRRAEGDVANHDGWSPQRKSVHLVVIQEAFFVQSCLPAFPGSRAQRNAEQSRPCEPHPLSHKTVA